jgi:serine phosphatase RsbU (regulator of sigma subunit)
VLVLYSDGVLDAVGSEDRFEGERLKAALTGATGSRNAVERVQRALADFQLGAQHDDIAIVAVERGGARARVDDSTPLELQPANRGG